MTIRVVIADDSLLVREGIARVLESCDDVVVAGACGDLPELLASAAALRPEVVVTDIRMPPTGTDEGIRAAAELRAAQPGLGVVVLSQFVEPAYVLDLLADGTEGRAYLLKERLADSATLLDAVRQVASGGSVVDPKVVDVLVRSRRSPATSVLRRLSPRELEVLAGIAEGRSNAAVAAALGLSERAVEKHINSLFSKLGINGERDVHRRVKAVLLYLAEQGG